jgi:hypothetical protein
MAQKRIQGLKRSRLQQLNDARLKRRRCYRAEIKEVAEADIARTETEDLGTHENSDCDHVTESNFYYYDSSSESSLALSELSEGEAGDDDDSEEEDGRVCGDLSAMQQGEESASQQKEPLQSQLKWNLTGEARLRGIRGNGSLSTQERRRRDARELQRQASQSQNIVSMFTKMQEISGSKTLDSSQKEPRQLAAPVPLQTVQEQIALKRLEALRDLERLLDLVTEQEKKYGYKLTSRKGFLQRHLMVKHFLALQTRNHSGKTRKELSATVAASFNRGLTVARSIIQREKSWVNLRQIPSRKTPDTYASWLNDENVVMAIRNFARKQKDSKYFLPI